MTGLVLTTLDWVPEFPRGFVRDLRVRWALEEASLPYTVATTPIDNAEARLPFQPFGQVPWLTDGDVTVFETGAILLHLGERHGAPMPEDLAGRAKVRDWLFAAANSVETAIMPTMIFWLAKDKTKSPGRDALSAFLDNRLSRLNAVVARQEWLAGDFSVADILMSDALRVLEDTPYLDGHEDCRDYVTRATARPAFAKAHADQIAHFEAADRERAKQGEGAQ